MTEIKIVKRKLVWKDANIWIFIIWALSCIIPAYFVLKINDSFAFGWILGSYFSFCITRWDIEKEVYKVKAKKIREN